MRSRDHTHKHALARQCLPNGLGAQSLWYTQHARSVAVSATRAVVIDGHEAGKRIQASGSGIMMPVVFLVRSSADSTKCRYWSCCFPRVVPTTCWTRSGQSAVKLFFIRPDAACGDNVVVCRRRRAPIT